MVLLEGWRGGGGGSGCSMEAEFLTSITREMNQNYWLRVGRWPLSSAIFPHTFAPDLRIICTPQ